MIARHGSADSGSFVDEAGVRVGEFLRAGESDPVSATLGVTFAGNIRGQVSEFTAHPLTDGVIAFDYIAGSYIASAWTGGSSAARGWCDSSASAIKSC